MRLLTSLILSSLLWQQVSAGLFGDDSSSTASASSSSSTSSSSSSSGSSTTSTSSEVTFLQELQLAEIDSMNCLISWVNLTTSAIGTCLDINSLVPLIVGSVDSSSTNSSQGFSDQLNTYLGTVCSLSCADSDISDARNQLQVCDSSNTLVSVFTSILDNYSTSYETLACSVHYNGTSDLCLPQVLSTSSTADSMSFFDNLVSGTNLDQYQDSVFTNASCTGCMYEMFKAAQYTNSGVRGQTVTNAFGDHLKNDCPSQSTTDSTGNTTLTVSVDWSNVEDQQIPDSLQVSQNTATASKATRRTWDNNNSGMAASVIGGLAGIVIGVLMLN